MARSTAFFAILTAACLALPVRSSAQGLAFDAVVSQGVTSVDALGSPAGFELGVSTGALWGGVGVRVSFRRLSEAGTRIASLCGAFFCEDGPFDRVYLLRTGSAGLTYRVVRSAWLDVAMVAAASFSHQSLRLTRSDNGETSSRDGVGPDLGVDVGADLGFGHLAWGLRPRVSVRYQRITASDCPLDAACYGGRNVGTLGVGLVWQVGR